MSTRNETWSVVSDADELRALVGNSVKRIAGHWPPVGVVIGRSG